MCKAFSFSVVQQAHSCTNFPFEPLDLEQGTFPELLLDHGCHLRYFDYRYRKALRRYTLHKTELLEHIPLRLHRGHGNINGTDSLSTKSRFHVILAPFKSQGHQSSSSNTGNKAMLSIQMVSSHNSITGYVVITLSKDGLQLSPLK